MCVCVCGRFLSVFKRNPGQRTGAAGRLSGMYCGSSSHNWSERRRGEKALERPLPRAEPLTKPWHNYAVKSTLLFKNPQAHITRTHSLPALPLALTVSINYPDRWGHESCNFNSTPGDALHVCLSAGGTTRRGRCWQSGWGCTGEDRGSSSQVCPRLIQDILHQHSTIIQAKIREGNRQTDREKQQQPHETTKLYSLKTCWSELRAETLETLLLCSLAVTAVPFKLSQTPCTESNKLRLALCVMP